MQSHTIDILNYEDIVELEIIVLDNILIKTEPKAYVYYFLFFHQMTALK